MNSIYGETARAATTATAKHARQRNALATAIRDILDAWDGPAIWDDLPGQGLSEAVARARVILQENER